MLGEILDISWPVNTRTPIYPGDCPYRVKPNLSMSGGDFCNLSSFEMSMHLGTHIDAPLHFNNKGKAIQDLDLSIFLGEAKVIEIDSLTMVTAKDIREHAGQFSIEAGDRVLLKIPRNEALLDKSEYCDDFVGIDQSAARFLVEKGAVLVGIEYLSIEKPVGDAYDAHRILLDNGVIILEGIDLRKVKRGIYFLACQPLNLEGANGSPVRAVLIRR